jgi:hypothetical protein
MFRQKSNKGTKRGTTAMATTTEKEIPTLADEVKLDTPEQVREAVAVLAAELLRLREMEVATARLVQGMDARIKLLTALVDHLRGVLEKHGMVPPRPRGVTNVN